MNRTSRKTYKPSVVRTAQSAAATQARAAAYNADSLLATPISEVPADVPDYGKLRASLGHIGSIRTLDEWRELTHTDDISSQDKLAIVTETIKALEGLYVHRRLKSVLYAVDPIQELRLLAQRISSVPMEDRTFHEDMLRILKQLNDMHTAYRLPPPYKISVAFLPFLLRHHYSTNSFGGYDRRYVVTHTLFDAYGPPHKWFKRGVEVLSWNGTPIDLQAEQSAREEEGSNPESDRALGLHFMTVRWLAASYPPDSPWVEIRYRDEQGTERDIRLEWHVLTLQKDPKFVARVQFLWLLTEPPPTLELLNDAAVNLGSQIQHLSRWGLFVPGEVGDEREMAAKAETLGLELEEVADFGKREELRKFTERHPELAPVEDTVRSLLPMFLEPKYLRDAERRFGYIRIRAFPLIGAARDQFVPEFRRLLSVMPGNGLVLDVRGNPGGSATNAEMLLQLLSPNEITPIDFQFAATPMTRDIVSREPGESEFDDWAASIGVATQIGAEYSAGRPITSTTDANLLGQEYFGPVLLITDAMSYSAADIFAAGFQDNGVGKILGVDETTGAGGSNVWFHREAVASGYVPGPRLPAGVDLQISARRCVRVKGNSGTVLENLGVKTADAGFRHRLTRNDLLHGDQDLLRAAVSILAENPERDLDLRLRARADMLTVTGSCTGMDQLDFYLNDRPVKTVVVRNGRFDERFGPFDTEAVHVLEINGFDTSSGFPIRVARYKHTVIFELLSPD